MARVITSLPQICHNIKCQHKPIQPPSVHNCSINSEYYKLTIMARPFPSFLPGAQHGRNINQSRPLPTSGLDSVPSGRLTIEHLLTVSPPPTLYMITCVQSGPVHLYNTSGEISPICNQTYWTAASSCLCVSRCRQEEQLPFWQEDKELNDTDNSSLRIKRYG